MNKICSLFVILAVLGDLAFCKTVYYPLPNKNQDEDYTGKFLGSLFTSEDGPHEARNDTLTTPAPITPPKPVLTTESVVYYPIYYQEPIYDPSYSPVIPPYPVFYNTPLDSAQLQFDSFGPYYPIVNNIPSVYSNELPPIPYLKPSLINLNTIPGLSKPISPSNAKPNKITKLNPTRIQIPSDQKSDNVNNVEIDDKIQDSLANEINKLLSDFYAKHLYGVGVHQKQEKIESAAKNDTDDSQDESRVLLLTTESINSVTNRTPSIAKDLVNSLGQEMTKKLDTDQSNQDVETDKPSLTNESEITSTSQSSINLNLSGAEATSQNETDDSRKLDLSTVDESTINVSTNESNSSLTKLENNQTSVDTKLNGSIPEDHVKTRRFFINEEGNECMEEAVIHNGEPYKLFTCAEKNYPGKEGPVKKTTKSDVTYYTEELSTIAPTTTESASQYAKSDEILSSR